MDDKITEIIFLLDRSGSMSGLEEDTIGGFNAFIKKQDKGNTLVTAVLFDHEYEVLWNGVNASQVNLTNKEYYVRGTTALLDAVGKTILDVKQRSGSTAEKAHQVLFVITTDGLENASREFNYEKIKQMISDQQEKDGWEFIFLGANIDVAEEANRMGIGQNNAFEFNPTADGVMEMYSMVQEEVAKKRK